MDIPLTWVEPYVSDLRAHLMQYLQEDEKWSISWSDAIINYLKL